LNWFSWIFSKIIKSLPCKEKIKHLSKRTGIGAPVDHKIKEEKRMDLLESKKEQG
jgi:hypothetical protein